MWGPQVSGELFLAGALALLCVVAGIMLYISMRFKWRMAAGAIVANLHDVVFILGLFSLFRWEFNLPVLAATLAILGYSVNESVVILTGCARIFARSARRRTAATCLTFPSPKHGRGRLSRMARRSWRFCQMLFLAATRCFCLRWR